MGVEIDITYTGNLRCEATHGPSKNTLLTDAPLDNGGKGEAFSPTDLVAAALGTCLITIMGKLADRHDWDLRGTRVHVVKEMVSQPLRRIGTLKVTVTLPEGRHWPAEARQRLENAAHTCPVAKSLHPEVQQQIEFVFPA